MKLWETRIIDSNNVIVESETNIHQPNEPSEGDIIMGYSVIRVDFDYEFKKMFILVKKYVTIL